MTILPEKNKLVINFNRCQNWEEKYLYIIELGSVLPKISKSLYLLENKISGCQSQVWIKITHQINGVFSFQGDSNSMIVKGLIAILFILYDGLNSKEIIHFDIKYWFKKLDLINHLTPSRMQGVNEMVKNIHKRVSYYNY